MTTPHATSTTTTKPSPTHVDEPKPSTPLWLRQAFGGLLVAAGPHMAFVGFFGAVFSANACGIGGDACDGYGQAGDEFGLMVLLLIGSLPTLIAGIRLVRSRE